VDGEPYGVDPLLPENLIPSRQVVAAFMADFADALVDMRLFFETGG
jgi:hypothetical protein